jgi:hypothetical protein
MFKKPTLFSASRRELDHLPQHQPPFVGAASIESQHKSIEQVLGKLTNVRHCTMTRVSHSQILAFTSALLDFLGRQPLRKLRVLSSIGVPATTILRLLTMAPIITFAQVHVQTDPMLLSDESQQPRVEELRGTGNVRARALRVSGSATVQTVREHAASVVHPVSIKNRHWGKALTRNCACRTSSLQEVCFHTELLLQLKYWQKARP